MDNEDPVIDLKLVCGSCSSTLIVATERVTTGGTMIIRVTVDRCDCEDAQITRDAEGSHKVVVRFNQSNFACETIEL